MIYIFNLIQCFRVSLKSGKNQIFLNRDNNRKNMFCNIRFSKNRELREPDLSKLNR